MGQFIQEGERVMFETTVSVEKVNRSVTIAFEEQNLDKLNYLAGEHVEHCNKMAQLGTKLAHMDGGVPQIEISMEQVDEYNLGLSSTSRICMRHFGIYAWYQSFQSARVEAYKTICSPSFANPATKTNRRNPRTPLSVFAANNSSVRNSDKS